MSTFNYGSVPPFQPQQYSSIPVNYQTPIPTGVPMNVQQPVVTTQQVQPIPPVYTEPKDGGKTALGIIVAIIVILLVIFLIMFIITYFKNRTQNQVTITLGGGLSSTTPAARTGRVTMLETFYSMFNPMSYGKKTNMSYKPQTIQPRIQPKRSHPARRMNTGTPLVKTTVTTSNGPNVDKLIQDLNKLDTDIMVISSDIARIRDRTSKLTSMGILSKASGELSSPKIDNIASVVSAINNIILELSLKQELINNNKKLVMENISKNNRVEAEKLYNNYLEEVTKCKQHISDLESKLTTIDTMLIGNPRARNAIEEMSSKIAKNSKPLTQIALNDPQLKALFSQPLSTDVKSQFPITTSLTGNKDISGIVKKIKESI
jgi:hypothetical protein